MKQIPIDTATPDQVRRFALMVGCDLSPSDSPETVAAKLKTVWNNPTITVADAPEDAIGALGGQMRIAPEDRQPGESSEFSTIANARIVGSVGRDDPRVILTVQRPRFGNEASTLQNYVSVGINGVGFQLTCGVALDVPYRVYEALKNAERIEITHDEQGEVVETPVLAFPFNVVEMPSRTEIAAWHAKIDAVEMA